MLEVGVDIASCRDVLPDAVDHRLPLFPAVTGLAKTVVDELRGDNVGSGKRFSFGHTERDITRLQQIVRLIAKPRRVSKLERRGHSARQGSEEILEQPLIHLEIW